MIYSFTIKEIPEQEIDDEKEVVPQKSKTNFLKEYEMPISLVIFGVGIISALMAVLVKKKSKVM